MATPGFQNSLSYPPTPDPMSLSRPLAEDKGMFLSTLCCLTCRHLERSIQLLCQAGGCRKCQLRQRRHVQLKMMLNKVKTTELRQNQGMGPLTWTASLVLTFQSKFIILQLIFKETPSLKILHNVSSYTH